MSDDAVLKTPLHALHVELGARMGPFAGYDMPIQYPSGILAEHLHTRKAAGLFDVSHMGQALLEGADHASLAAFLETLVPADILNLAPGRQRYTQLLNESGGIIDDLMATRPPGADGVLRLVVNAARKAVDFALIRERLPSGHAPDAARRSGADRASGAARGADPGASRAGRRAGEHEVHERPARPARRRRDLRLPLRLYGRGRVRDLASRRAGRHVRPRPAERARRRADRTRRARFASARGGALPLWPRARRDRRSGRGRARLVDPEAPSRRGRLSRRRAHPSSALANGPDRLRVGLRPDGRAPAREGTEIVSAEGAAIGVVTSGGFGPSVGAPIAMGFVDRAHAPVGTAVGLVVRGKALSARVAALPFHPHAYYRG